MMDFEKEYGFKQLTLQNALAGDDIWNNFVDTNLERITFQNWFNDLAAIVLSASVPKEVRSLFEVSRAALIYGWCFYPLLTLGAEQLFRVPEAAARIKLRHIRGADTKESFKDQISRLAELKAIPLSELDSWNYVRALRNHGAHPTMQSILPPGQVITIATNIAHLVESLFDPVVALSAT